jgi:hypothetical protein
LACWWLQGGGCCCCKGGTHQRATTCVLGTVVCVCGGEGGRGAGVCLWLQGAVESVSRTTQTRDAAAATCRDTRPPNSGQGRFLLCSCAHCVTLGPFVYPDPRFRSLTCPHHHQCCHHRPHLTVRHPVPQCCRHCCLVTGVLCNVFFKRFVCLTLQVVLQRLQGGLQGGSGGSDRNAAHSKARAVCETHNSRVAGHSQQQPPTPATPRPPQEHTLCRKWGTWVAVLCSLPPAYKSCAPLQTHPHTCRKSL